MNPYNLQLRDDRVPEALAGEYRSFVVRRLRVAPDRRGVGWISAMICSHPAAASEENCVTCEDWARYLQLAFTKVESADLPNQPGPGNGDPAKVHLWVGMESVCGEARDFELVRLDFDTDPVITDVAEP